MLDKLSVRIGRATKGEVWLGEPERPRVVMDRRRLWFDCALTAADIELEKGGLPVELLMVGLPEPLDLENSSVKADGFNDARRWWFGGDVDEGELARSVDMSSTFDEAQK